MQSPSHIISLSKGNCYAHTIVKGNLPHLTPINEPSASNCSDI